MSGPRENRHGSACPDWCSTDHAPRTITGGGKDFDATLDRRTSTGDTVVILAAPGEGGHAIAYAWQSLLKVEHPETQIIVDAHADRNGRVITNLDVTADDAHGIAGLVEAMAHATPEQHLQLAAQLRSAVSILTMGTALNGGAS